MNQSALFALQVYGISIVIALLVTVLIKLMVSVTGRLECGIAAKTVPQGEVCPVVQGIIPDEDEIALSAAIFSSIGAHHILHISPTSRAWVSHGWAAQPTSYTVFQRPQH